MSTDTNTLTKNHKSIKHRHGHETKSGNKNEAGTETEIHRGHSPRKTGLLLGCSDLNRRSKR